MADERARKSMFQATQKRDQGSYVLIPPRIHKEKSSFTIQRKSFLNALIFQFRLRSAHFKILFLISIPTPVLLRGGGRHICAGRKGHFPDWPLHGLIGSNIRPRKRRGPLSCFLGGRRVSISRRGKWNKREGEVETGLLSCLTKFPA